MPRFQWDQRFKVLITPKGNRHTKRISLGGRLANYFGPAALTHSFLRAN